MTPPPQPEPPVPLLVTGAAGRVGRMLQRAAAASPCAGLMPMWSARGGGDLPWDIGTGPPPSLPMDGIVLHLAGATRGPALDDAALLALRVCEAARAAGARHVFLASTAAVYAPGAGAHAETDAPYPASPYGKAKQRMETAALDWRAATEGAPPVTLLRIGNVAGADALFAAMARQAATVVLDPVAGQPGGPGRSCIGPGALWRVVAALAEVAVAGGALPPFLNVAQAPPLAMADILQAAGANWRFGPQNAAVMPRAVLDTRALQALVPLPPVTAASLVADWRATQPVTA